MKIDDPTVLDILRRSMVARIATLSRNGRPSINPLYFVASDGHLWLGTSDWTLAARNVTADSRVSILFNVEKDPTEQRVLRISGRANVRTDQEIIRSYNICVARKYILTPAGIINALAHLRQIPLKLTYNAQGSEKGQACVIDILPERAEFLYNQSAGNLA